MWMLTIKVFHRRYEGDNTYHIESVLVADHQLGYWLAEPKNWSRELLNYRRCN